MDKENKELAKQRVTITPELKVSVLTDRGSIEDGTERVLIKGDFVIDARSVALLTTALAGKAVREMWFSDRGYVIIAPADAVSTLSEELKKQEEEYDEMENIMGEKLADKEGERHKLKCENVKLRHKIKQFNESRRPWERKLKIEE
jgi:hypothetical protein